MARANLAPSGAYAGRADQGSPSAAVAAAQKGSSDSSAAPRNCSNRPCQHWHTGFAIQSLVWRGRPPSGKDAGQPASCVLMVVKRSSSCSCIQTIWPDPLRAATRTATPSWCVPWFPTHGRWWMRVHSQGRAGRGSAKYFLLSSRLGPRTIDRADADAGADADQRWCCCWRGRQVIVGRVVEKDRSARCHLKRQRARRSGAWAKQGGSAETSGPGRKQQTRYQ